SSFVPVIRIAENSSEIYFGSRPRTFHTDSDDHPGVRMRNRGSGWSPSMTYCSFSETCASEMAKLNRRST
ncbi:hypothetical protein PFISCL1PPCAC_26723, partial [Pristionchus fissidentatus]